MQEDPQITRQLTKLADHLLARRAAILENWRHAVDEDPDLTAASTLARKEFYDHIPAVLDAFDQRLRARYWSEEADAAEEQKERAAEHGLHRWHHGYNQRDVMREWTHLHLGLVHELENCLDLNRQVAGNAAMALARRALAQLCSDGVNESAARYAELQQAEAAGRIQDLEQALETLGALEHKRIETWRRAVHDVRGNFGVIKNIADQLSGEETDEALKAEFLNLLQKSVAALHDLLNNLLVLSRLEAGQEERDIQAIDAALLMKELADSFQPMAAERGLWLRVEGPASLPAQGDAINIQRIAQNLLLNALKYTREGGVTISWEELETDGLHRWALRVRDTGPGFQPGAAAPLAQAIEESTAEAKAVDEADGGGGAPAHGAGSTLPKSATPRAPLPSGEGIGLAIVKRLCELLDATLELESEFGRGSAFRIVFPRSYDMP
jgi:signal transduction histidine kinase